MVDVQQRVGAAVRELRKSHGWTQEELGVRAGLHSTYVGGIERGERNVTLKVLARLANALDVDLGDLLPRTRRHPLEDQWDCSWQDILGAVGQGFRARVNAKGKLAEYFLAEQLEALRDEGTIASFVWSDKDGEPDFVAHYGGRALHVECKNVRSSETPAVKVELQKTRDSKHGRDTRAYRVSEFDVIAACLFNRTGKWEYAFVATERLERRLDDATLLKTMQTVPVPPESPWHSTLREALEDAAG